MRIQKKKWYKDTQVLMRRLYLSLDGRLIAFVEVQVSPLPLVLIATDVTLFAKRDYSVGVMQEERAHRRLRRRGNDFLLISGRSGRGERIRERRAATIGRKVGRSTGQFHDNEARRVSARR